MSDPVVGIEVPTMIDLSKTTKVEDIERQAILYALNQTGGVVVKAAVLLGLGPATVYRKIRAYSKMGDYPNKRMVVTEAVKNLRVQTPTAPEQPALGIYQEPQEISSIS